MEFLVKITEVLKLKPQDVQDRKLHLPNPKSGRASEVVFIPHKVADRLREYIATENILDDERIFSLGYTRAREIVKNYSPSFKSVYYPAVSWQSQRH